MGKPLMIQEEDDQKIEELKEKLGAPTKIAVVRKGLELLAREAERLDRVRRWEKSVQRVKASSRSVNRDFRGHSRLKRIDD